MFHNLKIQGSKKKCLKTAIKLTRISLAAPSSSFLQINFVLSLVLFGVQDVLDAEQSQNKPECVLQAGNIDKIEIYIGGLPAVKSGMKLHLD